MNICRQFVIALCAIFIGAPLATHAQPMGKVYRLGVIGDRSDNLAFFEALEQSLRENGYIEGQNIRFEYRATGGQSERLPTLAAELVKLQVDAIFVGGDQAIKAVKEATRTIPIVMVACDAVAAGLVASLSRPGGNVTGVSCNSAQLAGKRLQILREITPKLTRVAVLYNQDDPGKQVEWRATEAASKTLGLTALPFGVRDAVEFDQAFAAIDRKSIGALIVLGDLFTIIHRRRIVELIARHRLPAAYAYRIFVDAGGLFNYGPSLNDMAHKAGAYVSKVLKGAKPADLPVEEPTKFELVVNLKTAKALGITIPKSVLARSDDVIQ